MTFTKLAYIGANDLDSLNSMLEAKGYGDKLSMHSDSNGDEVWLEINEEIISYLVEVGIITDDNATEMLSNEADTILFY